MPEMRIVSLLPSATEILFALGLGQQVVGVSHECDYPAEARSKTVVVHSRLPKDLTPVEIDRHVREFTERGESIYGVNGEILRRLAPDLIVTQNLCSVCAASPEDLSAVLATFDDRPEVLSLDPLDLGDVWRDILWVGDETMRGHEAERLLEAIGQRLAAIESEIAETVRRPRVAFLEWLQPIYVGGHWIPEMIELAGVAAEQRVRQRAVAPEEAAQVKPDQKPRHRVEEPLPVALEPLVHEERAVGQRALEERGDERAGLERRAVARDDGARVAGRLHRRETPVLHPAEEHVLSRRPRRRQLLQRVHD